MSEGIEDERDDELKDPDEEIDRAPQPGNTPAPRNGRSRIEPLDAEKEKIGSD